jgi:hypothetical protein
MSSSAISSIASISELHQGKQQGATKLDLMGAMGATGAAGRGDGENHQEQERERDPAASLRREAGKRNCSDESSEAGTRPGGKPRSWTQRQTWVQPRSDTLTLCRRVKRLKGDERCKERMAARHLEQQMAKARKLQKNIP